MVPEVPALPSRFHMTDNTTPLLDIQGPVATITLNRIAHRNRLHNEDLLTLLAHCDQVNADPSIRVVVLTARTTGQARPVFCAGFHVGEFDNDEPVVAFEKVPDAIEALRPVTICAMPGSVYGGATDVALACDFRIGVHGMALRMPAAALGLHYYPSGLARYVSRLGLAAAKKAFLTACNWSDTELLKVGYLDEICAPQEIEERVREWTKEIQKLAPLAVSGMKKSLNELAGSGATPMTYRAIREREQRCANSADFAEGRRSFAEKRPPMFNGN
jgi:enoyl-CoA hydratase/carnithine racemase